MNYGKKLVEIREKNKMSAKQIAEALGVSIVTYNRYEKGDATIPLKHLNTFCNHYHMAIDYFFGLTSTNCVVNYDKEIDRKVMAERIKNFRKENGLTQITLAKLLKIANGTIAEYELGNNIIATPYLYAICKKYKVSADYILGRTNAPAYYK